MEKRKFGRTDMEFSVLGFGGAEIGFNAQQTQIDVDTLLNSALDAGLNVTALSASVTGERSGLLSILRS